MVPDGWLWWLSCCGRLLLTHQIRCLYLLQRTALECLSEIIENRMAISSKAWLQALLSYLATILLLFGSSTDRAATIRLLNHRWPKRTHKQLFVILHLRCCSCQRILWQSRYYFLTVVRFLTHNLGWLAELWWSIFVLLARCVSKFRPMGNYLWRSYLPVWGLIKLNYWIWTQIRHNIFTLLVFWSTIFVFLWSSA